MDGADYLFTATSGTGKSSYVRLWREYLGDRAVMVNDDKPLLRIIPEGVRVYGTPWNGKHCMGTNLSVPLKAICVPERGEQNEVHEISVREVLPILMQQSCHPRDRKDFPWYLSLIDGLAEKLQFYLLRCNMDPEAAQVLTQDAEGHGHVHRCSPDAFYWKVKKS